ncbi:hypothetical protein AGMMS49574_13990 [Bacteroidia bacterium]|nr:hypothetical protein AGMMS49574_13990 [Bacteroidia bacterium]GHV04751.1 hypothetical protein FACS189416_3550 [Bacteroidia bacterium]
MLKIGNTLVSLDILERFFVCDLSICKGACCIEGDAGAPLDKYELAELQKVLPTIWNGLRPEAQAVIRKQGVAYIDAEGETVTSIVNGKDCVFTFYDEKGICKCAIEKAWREGLTDFMKPVSCHLYPIRVKEYENYKAVNYDRWRICKCAEVLGRQEQIPLYRFLKEPLVRKFGQEWYNELELCATEWMKQY